MTSLQALEAYSGSHSDTFDELLEWPYRRFMKAFEAWQKRNAVDEVENRKNLHVQALQTITEWKEEGDQGKAIEEVENYYEMLKNFIWNPEIVDQENKEMQELEEQDSFLAAGKRNVRRIVPPKMPNQDDIEGLLE
jgi:hypothetical protein